MKSNKLQSIFLVLGALFIIHGLEEYATGFYHIDWSYRLTFGGLSDVSSVFLLYQFSLWILLLLTFILLKRGKRIIWLLMIWGIGSVLELQHVYASLMSQSYYPGLITSLLFPIVGFFFWKELLKNRRTINKL